MGLESGGLRDWRVSGRVHGPEPGRVIDPGLDPSVGDVITYLSPKP